MAQVQKLSYQSISSISKLQLCVHCDKLDLYDSEIKSFLLSKDIHEDGRRSLIVFCDKKVKRKTTI